MLALASDDPQGHRFCCTDQDFSECDRADSNGRVSEVESWKKICLNVGKYMISPLRKNKL